MRGCRRLTALAATLACAVPAVAAAQDPEWTVDVGAVARARPSHLGSTRYVTDAAPVLEARYGDLSISFDDGAKWVAARAGPVAAGPILEFRQSWNDDLPPEAFHMADVFEAGGFVEAQTPIGVAEARLRHAVGGYDGWAGDLSFSTGAEVAKGLELGGQARLSWADANFTQEYFGLRRHDARRFDAPRFREKDYLSAGAEIDLRREITPKLAFVAALSADRVLGEVAPTPLLHTRNAFSAAVGFTWRFSSRP